LPRRLRPGEPDFPTRAVGHSDKKENECGTGVSLPSPQDGVEAELPGRLGGDLRPCRPPLLGAGDDLALGPLHLARLAAEKMLQDAARDLDLIILAQGYLTSIGDDFPEHEVSDRQAFTITLLELHRKGRLLVSANAARAPDGNGESVVTVMNRLSAIAEDLAEAIKDLSAEQHPGVRQSREGAIKKAEARL
jgi:hypothetical protein